MVCEPCEQGRWLMWTPMRSRPRHRSSSRMEWVWISTRYLHEPSSRLVSARGPYVTLTHTLPAYLPGNVIIVDCTARQGCNSLRSFIAGCLSQRCPLLCFQFNLLSSPCRAKHPNTHYVSGAGAWQSLAELGSAACERTCGNVVVWRHIVHNGS